MSSSPIRGRDEHLDVLAGFLQRVGAGTGGVVIIEGDAGLGKTRLLAAARETARTLDFRTGLDESTPDRSPDVVHILVPVTHWKQQ